MGKYTMKGGTELEEQPCHWVDRNVSRTISLTTQGLSRDLELIVRDTEMTERSYRQRGGSEMEVG